MINEKEKYDLLTKNELVRAIVYDALHKRRSKYSTADNSGQHSDYKEMIRELANDYLKQINKSKTI